MIEQFKKEIERQLTLALEDETLTLSPELREAVYYSVFPTGKCIRPLIACALAQDLGADGLALAPMAAALELIHVSTLIHDDLPEMDNDALRRGKPSTHKKYGHATALLAGNYLALRAIEWVLQQEPTEISAQVESARTLSKALCLVNVGQLLDLQKTKPTEDRQLEREKQGKQEELVDQLKTGSLFSAAFQLAAAHAGSISARAAHIFPLESGTLFGLIFQQRDDMLDGERDRPPMTSLATLSGIFRDVQAKGMDPDLLDALHDVYEALQHGRRYRGHVGSFPNLRMVFSAVFDSAP